MFITGIKTKLSKYIDINYFLRFFLLLVALYYFNVFYIAIVDKKGMIYSSFLDNYLNYLSCIRYFILYTAKAIAHVLGVNSYIYFPDYLKTLQGSWIRVEAGCLGIDLLSFWVAFVVASKDSLKRKILWSFAGIISITFINCCRIALLLIAFERHWNAQSFSTNHALSSYAVYTLIVFMIYLFPKAGKKQVKNAV